MSPGTDYDFKQTAVYLAGKPRKGRFHQLLVKTVRQKGFIWASVLQCS